MQYSNICIQKEYAKGKILRINLDVSIEWCQNAGNLQEQICVMSVNGNSPIYGVGQFTIVSGY